MAAGFVTIDPDNKLPAAVLGELNATYARKNSVKFPRGPRLAQLGDSIIAAGDGLSEIQYTNTIGHFLAATSGGRLVLVKNAGVAGDTTADMLARFDADVTPHAPDVVLVRGGTNDVANGVPIGDFQANIEALVDKVYGIGAVPLLDTITPVDYATAADNTEIRLRNIWLKDWCAQRGIRCGDSATLAASGKGQVWRDPDLTSDGLHPVTSGHLLIARAILNAAEDLPAWPVRHALDNDSVAYLPNGLFAADTDGNGISDGWTAALSGNPLPAPTYERTTEEGVPGTIQKITLPATSGNGQVELSSPIDVSAGVDYEEGDRIRLSCLMRLKDTDPNPGRDIGGSLNARQFSFTLGAADSFSRLATNDTRGDEVGDLGWLQLDREFTARANDTTWRAAIAVRVGVGSGSTGGAGVAEFAAVKWTNLTRLGI